jgi:hypothetical protein
MVNAYIGARSIRKRRMIFNVGRVHVRNDPRVRRMRRRRSRVNVGRVLVLMTPPAVSRITRSTAV